MVQDVNVVLVEDEPDYLEVLELFLDRKLPEFVEISSFLEPDDALEYITDEVDVIVSDLDMPGMNGLELYEEVRKKVGEEAMQNAGEKIPEDLLEEVSEDTLGNVLKETSDVPFILHTGKGSEELAGKAIDAGIDGYVMKSEENQYKKLSGKIMEHSIQSVIETRYERLQPLGNAVVNSNIPFLVIDEEIDIHFSNDVLLNQLGYTFDELVGEEPSKINDIPEEDYDKEDDLWSFEDVKFYSKDGETKFKADSYLIANISEHEGFRVALAYSFHEIEA